MNLLDVLGEQVPKSSRDNRLLQLVRNHFQEFSQARECGFSWSQIFHAAKALWGHEANIRSISPLTNYFYKVRKEFNNEQ